jgi:acyl transferase domain-containing protein
MASGSTRGAVQVAVVASDLDDLAAKLPRAQAHQAGEGVVVAAGQPGQIAFLFPGQGSQSPGMLADLFVAFPRLRRHLGPLGQLAPVMFPPAAFNREEAERQRAAITDTRVAQPTLGVADLAMHELLATFGVRPDLAGGHSYGELVALAAAGAVDHDALVAISGQRADAILAAAGDDPGSASPTTTPPPRS